MSQTIDLTPEEERDFRQIAASAHLDAESYVVQVIRRMVHDEALRRHILAAPEGDPPADVRERIQRMHEDIQALGLKGVPFYPDEVMTREWVYGDHP